MAGILDRVERLLPFLKSYSIRRKIRVSYVVIIAIMLLPSVTSVAVSLYQTARYDRIITNVSKTNELNQIVKIAVTNEIWDIVAGNIPFDEGEQYVIIRDINARLAEIKRTTIVTGNRQILEVAGRAMNTLSRYVDRMGVQTRGGFPVSENEKILEEVRGVSALVSDILQDFIVLEIEAAARTNESIKRSTWMLAMLQIGIVLFVTAFAMFAQRSVSRSINRPIKELEIMSKRIADGDLSVRVEVPRVRELDRLTEYLNVMAVKIRELIETNVREQKNLQKSEMKALQAQITPHFLYNTFDTIIWLAEAHRYDQVIEITRAFSSFFRISLNRGKDWITVAEELDHVRSYLTIQKIRYRDILDYEIESGSELSERPIVKLLLQPLVENALYHGIKNKRGKGMVTVRVRSEGDNMVFSVEDDGIGITDERLADIRRQISEGDDEDSISDVYGLYNVSKRLDSFTTGPRGSRSRARTARARASGSPCRWRSGRD